MFVELVELALTRGFYDPAKKDIMGFSHDLELLLLGSLFFLGWDTTFEFISTNNEIDSEVQRVFHHRWTKNMMSIKDEYIHMPRDEAELEFVVDQYDCYGFPGCVGSIDVVQIGWSNCPSSWLPLFKGKDKHASIGFQVIVSARRFIQAVSVAFAGTINDNVSVLYVPFIKALQPGGDSWLNKILWYTEGEKGELLCFKGCYVI